MFYQWNFYLNSQTFKFFPESVAQVVLQQNCRKCKECFSVHKICELKSIDKIKCRKNICGYYAFPVPCSVLSFAENIPLSFWEFLVLKEDLENFCVVQFFLLKKKKIWSNIIIYSFGISKFT